MEPKKTIIIAFSIFCFSLFALSATAGEVPHFTNAPIPSTELQMFADPDFQEMEQGGYTILRSEEYLTSPILHSLPESVRVNGISGPIANFGSYPVVAFLFVGDAQSLQSDMMGQAVLSGVIMPGAVIDAADLLRSKGCDKLSRNLFDAMTGVDVRAILVFMSAGHIDGYFSGLEYNATITY